MADDKVSIVFEALVGSTTKSTFQTLTKGFQDFAKGLRQSAKELSKMQQSQAADALGHVAMQVEKLSGSLSKMGQGTSKAKTQLQSLENSFKTLLNAENKNAEAAKQVMETYKKGGMSYKAAAKELNRLNTAAKIAAQSEQFLANETDLVNKKWKQMIPMIQNGSISFNQAVGTTKNFGKAIEQLRRAVYQGGGSLTEFDKKLEQLNVGSVSASKNVKLVGSSFKIYNKEGAKAVGLVGKNAEAVRKYNKSLTTHEKIVNRTGQEQVKLQEALAKTGNRFKNNQMRMDAYAQNLYKSEKAITALTGSLTQNSGVSAKALKNVDRMGIAVQAEAQNLKITSNGFKILNNQGLKPFGNLSLEAAGKLKMLGTGFETLVSKEKELATRTGKTTTEVRAETTAMWEAGKSIKQINAAHQKELTTLNKSVTQYEKMKRAASNLKQTYSESLNPLNALNKTQKESQSRMKLWLQQMNKGKGDLTALSNAIKKEAKSFQSQGKAIAASKAKAGELNDKFGSLLKTTDGLTASQKRNLDKMRGWVRVLEKGKGDASALGKKVNQAAKNFNAEAAAIKKSSAAHKTNVDHARQLSTQYKSLVGSLRRVTGSSKGTTEAQKRLKIQAVNLIREVKKGNKTFGYARAKLQELKKQFQEAEPEASMFERAISKLASSLKTYGSYMFSSQVLMGMANAFRSGTQAVIEHDQALHNLKAIMNATETEMRTLDDTMLSVAQSTKFSIAEVGQAMVRFGQAGFTASEAVAGMQDIASLATGTLESLEETVNLVATGVRVFRLEMDQTSMVADVFANAVNNSRLTLHKLNIAFNYIGPLAKAAGLSLKDTTASLQLLANAGVRASTTGTGLRRVISGLLDPSTALAEAIKDAGYQVDDFNPLMHDFSTIVGRLPDVVNNAGDAVEMFGLRGSAVVSAFATQGVKEFDRLRLGLNETGAASRMAAEQMKGLQNMLKNVKDKFGVFASTLVKGGVLSGIKAFINLIRGTLAALTALADTGIGHLVVTLSSLTAAFTVVAGAVRAFIKLGIASFFKQASIGATAFIGSLMQLDVAAAASSAQVTKLDDALRILGQGFKKVGTAALTFISSPIRAAIAGIGVAITGTVVALTAYEKHLKSVQEEQNNLAGGLNTTISSFENFREKVEKYGTGSSEASNAALALRTSAEKLGDEYEELTKITDKLTSAIDEETGALNENVEALSGYNSKLNEEYINAVIEAAVATENLYEKQRWTAGILDKLVQTLNKTGNTLLNNLLYPLRLLRDALIETNKAGWLLISLLPGFDKAADRAVRATNRLDDALRIGVNSTQEAREEWKRLQEVVASGKATDKEKERFKELSKYAERFAKEIHESGSSVEEFIKKHEKLRDSLLLTVAIKEAYADIQEEAKEAADSVEGQFGKIVDSLQEEIVQVGKEGTKSFSEMIKMFDGYASKVFEKATEMYAFQTGLYKRQTGAYKKFKGDQEKLDAFYVQNLKEILLESYKSRVAILDKQRTYVKKTYALELENLSDYYDNKKERVENAHNETVETNERALEAELAAIRKKDSTELELEKELWSKKEGYFFKHLKNAEDHAQKLIQLADERFRTEKDKARDFIQEEEKLKEAVVELEQEKYEAKISSFEDLEEVYSDHIDTLRDKEEDLTDKIKSEVEEREEFKKSQEENLRDIEHSILTDTQLLEAKKTEATEAQAEAREAITNGEAELAKEKAQEAIKAEKELADSLDPEETAGYAYEIAKIRENMEELGKIYTEASKKIETSQKEQRKSVEKDLSSLEKRLTEVNQKVASFYRKKAQMGEGIDMSSAINEIHSLSTALDETSQKMEEIRGFINSLSNLSVEKQVAPLKEKLETFSKERIAPIKLQDAKDRGIEKAINVMDKKLDEATEDKEREATIKMNVIWKHVEEGESVNRSVLTPSGLSSGGKLSGYGGGDKVQALLEPGEYVIKKEAVEKYGAQVFETLNKMRLGGQTSTGNRFASGGQVEGGTGNIAINFKYEEEKELDKFEKRLEDHRKKIQEYETGNKKDRKTTLSLLRQEQETIEKVRKAEVAWAEKQVELADEKKEIDEAGIEKEKQRYALTFKNSEKVTASIRKEETATYDSYRKRLQATKEHYKNVLGVYNKTLKKMEEKGQQNTKEYQKLSAKRTSFAKSESVKIAELSEKTEEARIKEHGTFIEKAKYGLKEYKESFKSDTEEIADNVKDLGETIEESLSNSILAFARGTKTASDAFESFTLSVVKQIQKTMVDSAVQDFMKLLFGKKGEGSGWLGTAVGWAGDLLSSIAHTGGTVGQTNFPKRMLPATMFANAPRLHNGLKGDEYPAILQKGEQVISKDEVDKSEPNIAINVINKTSEKAGAKQGKMKWDGEKWVINVVLDAMDKNKGGFKNNMKSMMAGV